MLRVSVGRARHGALLARVGGREWRGRVCERCGLVSTALLSPFSLLTIPAVQFLTDLVDPGVLSHAPPPPCTSPPCAQTFAPLPPTPARLHPRPFPEYPGLAQPPPACVPAPRSTCRAACARARLAVGLARRVSVGGRAWARAAAPVGRSRELAWRSGGSDGAGDGRVVGAVCASVALVIESVQFLQEGE